MKRNKRVIGMLSLALAVLLLISGCMVSAAEEITEEEVVAATAVEVQQLQRTDIRNELSYIGKVEPQKSIAVISRLAAEVRNVNFDVGDRVEAGQVLFTVDASDIQDQIRQLQVAIEAQELNVETAEFGLELAQEEDTASQRLNELQYESGINQARYAARSAQQAKENLEDTLDDLDGAISSARYGRDTLSQGIKEAEAALKEMDQYIESLDDDEAKVLATMERNELKNELKEMEKELNSLKSSISSLESTRYSTDSGLDSAKLGQQQAKSASAYAQESYEVYKEAVQEGREQAVRQAEFGVQAAELGKKSSELQLSIAMNSLGYATVSTPISGIISSRSIEVGQMISQSSVPFMIVDMDTVNVEVNISEMLINSIFPGDEVQVSIQALGNEVLTGTVVSVSPVANQTSTYPVKVQLPNEDGRIKPGMFAQVVFVKESRQNTFVVNKNIVMKDENSQYVYVVENGQAVKRVVETGLSNGQQMEILSGLSSSDLVVVVGQEYLYDGTLVNIVRQNGEAAQEQAPEAAEETGEEAEVSEEEPLDDGEAADPEESVEEKAAEEDTE